MNPNSRSRPTRMDALVPRETGTSGAANLGYEPED
jgi:hypothetical protein